MHNIRDLDRAATDVPEYCARRSGPDVQTAGELACWIRFTV